MVEIAAYLLAVVVAAMAYREGGRPKEHNAELVAAIRVWLPDYDPYRTRVLPKFLARGITALCIALVSGGWYNLPLLVIVTAAFSVGFTIGPGGAVGPALHRVTPRVNGGMEKWQVGALRDNAWLSLAALGALRASGCIVLLFFGFSPVLVTGLILASTVATLIAVRVAIEAEGSYLRAIPGGSVEWAVETERSEAMWADQEWLYGGLVTLLALGLWLVQ